jgi:hypothetical protein
VRSLLRYRHRASTDTSVALIIAKTVSPFLRFIRFTEPVVMIEVTGPAAVLITISETTLSETISSIVPGKRLRMLVLMTLVTQPQLRSGRRKCGETTAQAYHQSLNSPAYSCVSITLPASDTEGPRFLSGRGLPFSRPPFFKNYARRGASMIAPSLPIASTGQPSIASLQSASSSGVSGCL